MCQILKQLFETIQRAVLTEIYLSLTAKIVSELQ